MTPLTRIGIVLVLACAGAMPAHAAPFTVKGSVTSQCFVNSPPSMNLTATTNGGSFTITSATSWPWTIACNGKSRLTVTANAITATPLVSASGNEVEAINYAVTVSNWTPTSPATVVTTAANKNGTNRTAIGTLDNTSGKSSTVTITATGFARAGGNTFVGNNYQGSITVSLAGIP